MSERRMEALEDQLEAQALDIASRMERLAHEGEWQDLAALSASIRDLVRAVPEKDRGAMLLKLRESNDAVADAVKRARRDLEDQLASIKRGQNAARAYQATNEMSAAR